MPSQSLPRYFISRAGAQSATSLPVEIAALAHVVDGFFAGGRHFAEREWVVATDVIGNLLALPDESRADFPEAIQAELTFNEMSGRRRKRLIETPEFFLFRLQLLEQPAHAVSLDDPVYLYGTLFGPYPAVGNHLPAGIEGQLTVTRADLLEGLTQGAQYAFHYAGANGDEAAQSRCFQLMLPADREDEIERGHGVVLAYSLLPPELTLNDVSNEMVISQLAYDMLSALKEDLEREDVRHPLRELVLPTPSRFALEQRLQLQGYEIKGDTAVKKFQADESFQGLLASVFGSLIGESLDLPPEGNADEFITIAASALATLPGWPSPRAMALRKFVRPTPPELYGQTRRHIATPLPARIPAATAPLPPPIKLRTVSRSDEPPTWMQDFIAAHRRPGEPSPRLTSTATVIESPPVADWMRDFAPHPQEELPKPDKSEAKTEPDWMKDFE